MSVLKFALLDIPVAIAALQKEVTSLAQQDWQPHFNKRDYEGAWDVLSLRSAGGTANIFAQSLNGEPFADTALMERCPSVRQLLQAFHCGIGAVRLLNLKAGAVIKEHTDKDLCFESGEARLHIPVFTNPLVAFFIDGEKVEMKEGECWYVNANLPHRLANKGTADRIHLVIDCAVNDWLADVFQRKILRKKEMEDEELTLRNKENMERTIAELRRQTGSETALELALNLETRLKNAIDRSGNDGTPVNVETVAEPADAIIRFIRSIGIELDEGSIQEPTFLPGIKIENGRLRVDRSRLLYPGDLLHEAGHIAVAPADERPLLNEAFISNSAHREAEEMMAIAWSYAAAVHLRLDPLVVFHDHGYNGGGRSIAENFCAGHYFGTPMLQWCGLTLHPAPGIRTEKTYPHMLKWLRE